MDMCAYVFNYVCKILCVFVCNHVCLYVYLYVVIVVYMSGYFTHVGVSFMWDRNLPTIIGKIATRQRFWQTWTFYHPYGETCNAYELSSASQAPPHSIWQKGGETCHREEQGLSPGSWVAEDLKPRTLRPVVSLLSSEWANLRAHGDSSWLKFSSAWELPKGGYPPITLLVWFIIWTTSKSGCGARGFIWVVEYLQYYFKIGQKTPQQAPRVIFFLAF